MKNTFKNIALAGLATIVMTGWGNLKGYGQKIWTAEKYTQYSQEKSTIEDYDHDLKKTEKKMDSLIDIMSCKVPNDGLKYEYSLCMGEYTILFPFHVKINHKENVKRYMPYLEILHKLKDLKSKETFNPCL